MSNKLPNFIVAGFPKCGTTSLFYYLTEHPEIYLPRQKELHFFSQHVLGHTHLEENKEFKKTYVRDIESYEKKYHEAQNELAIGDVSPSYAVYPTSIPYIKKYLGENVKIIILVRDPVNRTFSNYLHAVREYREKMEFYESLMDEPRRIKENYADFLLYTKNSFYSANIKKYKESFNDVLVLTQEDLLRDTKGQLSMVYRFLNVQEGFIPKSLGTKFNEGGAFSDNFITRFILKPNPLRTFITKNIPMTSTVKRFKRAILGKYRVDTPKLDLKSEKYLIEIFKEEVSELSNMGVNVSNWNQQYFK